MSVALSITVCILLVVVLLSVTVNTILVNEKEDILFTAADFLKVKKITEIPETDTKTFYLVVDEYGYPWTTINNAVKKITWKHLP